MDNISFYTIIESIFILSLLINLCYWLIGFSKFYSPIHSSSEMPSNDLPVSIIISAKNEAENLNRLIPILLKQHYYKFEIVIIDDCSTDETSIFLKQFVYNPMIKIVSIDIDQPGKKYAITEGIKRAQYEHLLFTDADCLPSSKFWIQTMMDSLYNHLIVLGYAPMVKTKSWINQFIRFETFLTAIQYFSYAHWGNAYMGVGRNMLYTKSLFKEAGGFESHHHIQSGDDDLFVNAIDNSNQVLTCTDEKSFMFSAAKDDLKSYYHQKTRHFSTSTTYKRKDQFLLGLFAISHIILYITLFILLFYHSFSIVLTLILTRWLLIMVVHYSSFKQLNVKDLWIKYPVLDIVQFFFYLIFAYSAFFPQRKSW